MTTVLVSGFIDVNKYDVTPRDSNKSLDFYLEKAVPFLTLPHPKIVFLERDILSQIVSLVDIDDQVTKLVPFEKEELWLWPERDRVMRSRLPRTAKNDKDTRDYMMVIIQKTRWMRMATTLNAFPESAQFVWVDFGLYYVVKDIDAFTQGFQSLVSKRYNQIRIAGGLDITEDKWFAMHYVLWYFLGGIFGGPVEKLHEFDRLMEAEVRSLLDQGDICWEVNIWYLIYRKHPELFDWYKADHNLKMITHY